MITCRSCGNPVADGPAICPRCGLAVAGPALAPEGAAPAHARQPGVGAVVTIIGAVLLTALASATGLLAWDRYRHDIAASPVTTMPSPTAPSTLGVAERALVRELSPAHFENCTSEQRPIEFVVAAVNCDLVRLEGTTVLVLRFTGESAMDEFTLPTFEYVDGSDCGQGRFYEYWENGLGTERGVLSCWHTADGTHWLAWSIYSTNIVMVATGTDLGAMYEWWLEGPFPDHA